MKKKFSILVLLSLVLICANSISAENDGQEVSKHWEIVITIRGEKEKLALKLEEETEQSCHFSNAKKATIINSNEEFKAEYPLGISYVINKNEIFIDLFSGMCDAGTILVGKINGKTIKGSAFSHSYVKGKNKVGTFKATALE